jgi:hypothetical protein
MRGKRRGRGPRSEQRNVPRKGGTRLRRSERAEKLTRHSGWWNSEWRKRQHRTTCAEGTNEPVRQVSPLFVALPTVFSRVPGSHFSASSVGWCALCSDLFLQFRPFRWRRRLFYGYADTTCSPRNQITKVGRRKWRFGLRFRSSECVCASSVRRLDPFLRRIPLDNVCSVESGTFVLQIFLSLQSYVTNFTQK